MPSFASALAHCLPELILAAGVLVLVLFGAIRGKDSDGPVTEMAAGLLAAAILVIFLGTKTDVVVLGGAFIDDGFGRFMKVLTLFGSLISLAMSQEFLAHEKIDKFEFPILILLSTLGMLMLISAANLIALYLGLELMSLALYVLAAFHRDNVRASEAGVKYFVLSALASGMLLYGASLLYGFAGTVSFAGIAQTISNGSSLGAIFGLVFIMAGLAFKMSAVPFHMWAPDVYEGAPTPVTTFFATAEKIAAVAITLRVLLTAFPGIPLQWRQIVIFISILSMILGAFGAIGQPNFKRLMAYSAIGHIGFALVGLAAGGEAGVSAVLAYMAIYVVMTLGTFAGILLMRVNGTAVESISDLSGLARRDGFMAFFLAMMMFSLAGVPPLAGFFAKWYVFSAAIQSGLYTLAVIGVLASALSAYYYLRVVKIMYFDEPAPAFDRPAPAPRIVLAVTGVLVVFLFAYPGVFVEATRVAASSLF
jgi:NADH-quinone oxidoreductase subunit N